MSDPDTQLGYACRHLFPDEPLSIADVEGYLSNAETLDYLLYSVPDGNEEFVVIAGAKSYHLEYRMGTWLGPHNSAIQWREWERFETATEVADFFARGGWSVLELTGGPGESDG